MLLPPCDPLGHPAGRGKYQNGYGNQCQENGQPKCAQDVPKLHDAHRTGYEQQWKNPREKTRGFLDLLHFHPPGLQSQQQKHQSIDAGRNRQRQQEVEQLSQQTENQNPCKLKNVFH